MVTINEMFSDERSCVRNRNKQCDGTHLGHDVQNLVWFFLPLGEIVIIFRLVLDDERLASLFQ